jgi:hypothetical protein
MDLQMQMKSDYKLVRVEDYEPLIGAQAVERIGRKAEGLRDLHLVHVKSTYYGGGVAEILSSLTLLMNATGIKTGWRVIQGRPVLRGKQDEKRASIRMRRCRRRRDERRA